MALMRDTVLHVKDKNFFLYILEYITKFLQNAEFSATQDGIRLRGIDPHNYCYADVNFKKSFFVSSSDLSSTFEVKDSSHYIIDVSLLDKILPQLRRAKSLEIDFNENELVLSGSTTNLLTKYRIKWNYIAEPIIPDPKEHAYLSEAYVNAGVFYDALSQVTAISDEIKITSNGESDKQILTLEASQGDFQVETEINCKYIKSENTTIETVSKYLKTLLPAIKMCKEVYLSIGENAPPRLELIHDAGNFIFYFSYAKEKRERSDRKGTSLPLIVPEKFFELIKNLGSSPENNMPIQTLVYMKLETSGGDHTRFGKMLGLLKRTRGIVYLTPKGLEFYQNIISDERLAKQKFLEIVSEFPAFKTFFDKLDPEKPKSKNQLLLEINLLLAEQNQPPVDMYDMSTLINTALWCDKIRLSQGLITPISE
ncbi:MAG: hypothetical protein WED07_12320 [Candidatus Freyarchaeum deiterrae]